MSKRTDRITAQIAKEAAELCVPGWTTPTWKQHYAKKDVPNGNMTAEQLTALFADDDRHPNALSYELHRCKMDVLVTLAYGEHAPQPLNSEIPEPLACLAYDEVERRQTARANLLAALGA